MSINGIGIGFRYSIADDLLAADLPELQWLELHPENYVNRGGRFRYNLDRARERYPFATHGLTLGFGAVEPPEDSYIKPLRAFLKDLGTPFHSEHLCFCGSDGVMLHDLLPLPFNDDAIETAAKRFIELQDRLDLTLAFENISYYAHPGHDQQMDEPDFIREVLTRADARLLLDVNNIWVNSQNHDFDPEAYIDRLPLERVIQIHVAGPTVRPDGLIIDTHGEALRQECYELLEYTLKRTGPRPVLLERDQNFPPFSELVEEIRQLSEIYNRATGASCP